MQARVREAFKRLGDETSQASSSAVDSRVRVDTTCEGNSKATGAGADASANTGGREREKGTHWLVIDAGKERDVVLQEVWSHVKPLVKNGVWRYRLGGYDGVTSVGKIPKSYDYPIIYFVRNATLPDLGLAQRRSNSYLHGYTVHESGALRTQASPG
jgi:hypothetical protein